MQAAEFRFLFCSCQAVDGPSLCTSAGCCSAQYRRIEDTSIHKAFLKNAQAVNNCTIITCIEFAMTTV